MNKTNNPNVELTDIQKKAKEITTAAILSNIDYFKNSYLATAEMINEELKRKEAGIPSGMFSKLTISIIALNELENLFQKIYIARHENDFEVITELNNYEIMILNQIEQSAHEKILRLD